MIILDMDGTLLDSNVSVLESSKEILKKMRKKGKIIVIATGRSIESAKRHLSSDFVDYILANNGAVWYDMQKNKIIKKSCLDNKIVIDIITEYKNYISYFLLSDIIFRRFSSIDEVISLLKNDNEFFHLSIDLIDSRECIKIIENIRNKYNDIEVILMQDSFSEHQWIDIFAKDNNKGTNLIKLCDYLNIDISNTICFGDGLNDIEMFNVSNISVAMNNALPEVKRVATHITKSHDEDGIYEFLRNYKFNN